MATATDISDLKELARRRVPRMFFDYADSGSWSESTYRDNEAAFAKYRLRQDPGKINAMASTKINFYNQHAVYMHDTPQQSLFGNIERFNSSGCVRVQNVRDLVTWLLRDTPGWNRTAIERGIASGQNTEIEVTNPVPLFFTYITAWSTEAGVVNFRDDIYRRDGVEELALGTGATL